MGYPSFRTVAKTSTAIPSGVGRAREGFLQSSFIPEHSEQRFVEKLPAVRYGWSIGRAGGVFQIIRTTEHAFHPNPAGDDNLFGIDPLEVSEFVLVEQFIQLF